jgi:hypothetical protein
MEKWGWEKGKSNGTWQSMHSPEIDGVLTVRVRVRPATQHDANPTSVFMEVYRLTTDGDGEMFWRGPTEGWQQYLSMEKAKAAKRKKAEQEAALAKAAERAAAKAAEHKPVLTIVPEEKGGPMAVPNKEPKPVRLPSKDVLEVLTEHDGPMTVKSIGKKLGLDMTNPQNIEDVANRGAYLVSKGLAERVMQGTYRVANSARTIDARVQHDVQREAVPQHQAPAAEVAPRVQSPASVVVESIDDTIEAVLDLLLPQGFKASHLRYIAPWIEATRRMVEEVSKG